MDEKEFVTLIKERYRAIYKLAFYLLNNEEEPKDVAQEVFAKAWKMKADLEFPSAAAWLRKTATNICIDLLRRRKFQADPISISSISDGFKAEDMDEGYSNQGFIQTLADPAGDPEASCIAKEKADLIMKAIEKLPIRLKIAILLRETEGRDYDEISQILKVPIGTVKSDIYRAKRLLRQRLRPIYNL